MRKRVKTTTFSFEMNKGALNCILDPKRDKICLLFEIDNQKISRYMRGYRLIAYKELIFVIGGQHELGLREFVKNVWVYDLFKEKWERSTLYEKIHYTNKTVFCNTYFVGCLFYVAILMFAFQAIIYL